MELVVREEDLGGFEEGKEYNQNILYEKIKTNRATSLGKLDWTPLGISLEAANNSRSLA